MAWLEMVLRRVSTMLVYVATFAVLALTAFVCLSAAMRYVVGSPFHFTEELVALLFLAMVFLTLPYATVRREHIRVTLFTGRLSGLPALLASVFSLLVMLVFAVWFTVLSVDFAHFAHRIGALSEQSGITLWPWMALIPLSMGLVVAISALQLLRVFAGESRESRHD